MHPEDGAVVTSSPDRRRSERAGGRSVSPGRSWLSPALTVLTVVALVTAMLAVWVRMTVLDTDRFMAVIEPALSDEAFPAALSDVVAGQALVALDLDTRVTATLDEFDRFLADAFGDGLDLDVDPAVRARLARRDRPTLTTLAPGIATALEARVIGVVDAFVRSDALHATVRTVDRLVLALVGLAVVLLVGTVVTARDRRRTLHNLGIGVVLGAGAAVLSVERIEAAILAEIKGSHGLRVAGVLLDEVTGNLRTVALVVAVSALLVVALAHRADGPGGWLGASLGAHRARSGHRTHGGHPPGQAGIEQREDHP